MQVHKPACVSFNCRPIQYRGKLGLSVSAALYFPLRDAAPFGLWTEASMWRFLAREMAEPLIDEGVLKTTPEYLVHAVAHPPSRPAAACAVRARVGPIEKTLVVHGDRVWAGRSPGAAQPYDAMPITWQRAYGGADHAANPLGKGRAADADGVQPLANIEYPQAPATRPDAVGVPAGFGRVDPTWSARAQYRGSYDERWLVEHAPGFPPDLQWRHFNVAPPDQWFPGPLRGDEVFEFENLHPTRRRLGGRLPGLRARGFINYRHGRHAGKLRHLAMSLTTLWFFPHAERAIAIFQGLADSDEDDAADIGTLMVAVERDGEPRADAHYLDVVQRREHPQFGAVHALIESDLVPDGLDLVDPEMAAIEADYKVDGFAAEAQYRGAEVKIELARERVRRLGLDPDALGVRLPPREKAPTLSELPALVERLLTTAATEMRRAVAAGAQDIIDAKALALQHGIDPQRQRPKGPPAFSAGAELRTLIARTLPGRDDLQAGAAQLLKAAPKLAQAEVALRMAYRAGAHLQPPADPLPAAAAAEHRARLLAALRSGQGLAYVNLTGADLSGLDLSGVDLQGAQMESANLRGSRLRRAKLGHAVLAHAVLEGADFGEADLRGANLGAARLAGARFDGADLSGAILSNAVLADVSFRGATLRGVQLLDAQFGACDCRGAVAPGLLFHQQSLAGVVADGADLSEATFLQCRLEAASFNGARLASATFIGCSAAGVDFGGAQLMQAVFTQGCDLSGCDFTRADLSRCNLRAAKLAGAVFAGARLDGADVSEADLSDADLGGASLRGALAVRTDLRRGRATASNWMDAIAQKADLRGADLSGANLFALDVSQARIDQATRLHDVVAERVRIHPRRRPEPLR